LAFNGLVEITEMLLDTNVDPAQVILGFGICLFLALVFLLKWQHRKEVVRQTRLKRGLRVYVTRQSQEAA
jgi:hypothetical protein